MRNRDKTITELEYIWMSNIVNIFINGYMQIHLYNKYIYHMNI